MSETLTRMAAILLEQDSFFSRSQFRRDYERSFGVLDDQSDGAWVKAFEQLESEGSLIAFDLEWDGIKGTIIEHEKHGTLDGDDLSILGEDEFYSIGPSFPIRLSENANLIAEQAASAGLTEALRLLRMMPLDSRTWTGLNPGLRFDEANKSRVIDLLNRADKELDSSGLSNFDARRASSLIKAALILAESPEPEPFLLMQIVRRLNQVLQVSSAVATLLSFFGVAK